MHRRSCVAEQFLVSLLLVLKYQAIGVALFLPLELLFPRSKVRFADRTAGIIFLLATAPVTALVSALVEQFRPSPLIELHGGLGSPILASIALALWLDFQFYVIHRLEHRFFWRFHAVHHSVRNLSAANSYHHWTEPLMGLTVVVPLMFLDVAVAPTLGFLTFLFTYQQFYIHSSARPHFGPFRRLLIDNRYHRIHHSLDPAHHHKNFGAMTPLWDWVFGTLYMPKSEEWPDVGLPDRDEPQSLLEWHRAPWAKSSAPAETRNSPAAS